jgi:hypothetical protein
MLCMQLINSLVFRFEFEFWKEILNTSSPTFFIFGTLFLDAIWRFFVGKGLLKHFVNTFYFLMNKYMYN